MKADLKSCPFCGDEGIRDQHKNPADNRVYYFVRCRNKWQKCFMPKTQGFPSKGTAAKQWNRRI